MTEAIVRPIAGQVSKRFVYYDLCRDLRLYELSATEIEIVQAARRTYGLRPLMFCTEVAMVTLTTEHAALMRAAQALRDALGLSAEATVPPVAFVEVLEVAVQRLRTNGVSDD
jgi:hypothetical protein